MNKVFVFVRLALGLVLISALIPTNGAAMGIEFCNELQISSYGDAVFGCADADEGHDEWESGDVDEQVFDLSLSKSVDDDTPQLGSNFTYTITVTNVGVGNLTGIGVVDVLPAEVVFVNAIPSQGIYDEIMGMWTIGDLMTNSSASLQIFVTENSSLVGTIITNTAVLAYCDQSDMNLDNDFDSVDSTVVDEDNDGGGGGGGGGGATNNNNGSSTSSGSGGHNTDNDQGGLAFQPPGSVLGDVTIDQNQSEPIIITSQSELPRTGSNPWGVLAFIFASLGLTIGLHRSHKVRFNG